MPHAVELFFDAESDARVRQAWRDLAVVTGSHYMTTRGVVPHVALAVVEASAAGTELMARLAGVARDLEPQPLECDGVACFDGLAPVVFLRLARTPWLMRAHGRVSEIAAAMGLDVDRHYRGDSWTPHCTLAQQFGRDRLETAMASAGRGRWAAPFRITAMALVEYPPTRVSWSQPVGRGGGGC